MATLSGVLVRVAQAAEDYVYRPLFFFTVLPPVLAWDWWTRRGVMCDEPKSTTLIEPCFVCEGTDHAYWVCAKLEAGALKFVDDDKEHPRTLAESIMWVLSKIRDVDVKVWRHMDEEEVRARLHHSFGRNIRNDLGLWQPVKTPIVEYFNSIGIEHPDDMSAIIFTACVRYLRREPMKLDEQIKFYVDYWKGLNVIESP